MHSGSKLVLTMFGLALLAGVLSWIYRYQAAHVATQFWGPDFAQLIAEPSRVTGFELYEAPTADTGDNEFTIRGSTYYHTASRDLTTTRGMVHLRHSILSDGNYDWDNSAFTENWRWCLQFSDGERVAAILFNEDFSILGRMDGSSNDVRTVDCTPMAETLREYFASAGIFNASKPAE